jgi:hypothetical protein
MKDNNETIKLIIKESNDYIEAFHLRNERYRAWTTDGKADFVKNQLEIIKDLIIAENDYFKSNLYVTESFPQIINNGKTIFNKTMKTIILNSGKVIAQGYGGEGGTNFHSIIEDGFQIHFSITLNGKIHIIAYGHAIEGRDYPMKLIATIDHPKDLNDEKIYSLVLEGIKFAKDSSFLFAI